MALILEVRTTTKKAAAQIKKFAAKAGADVKTMEKRSVSSANRMSSAFSNTGRMLGALGLGVGIAGTIRGLKNMISAASDTQESLNKVREVFGDAADAVEKFSETAAKGLGASREKALAMTGEIGNLLVAMKFSEDKAADFSTKMVQLAADLGSFNNVPTVDALNAIRSALVGESEPIRRFGADVRQTRLDQIALGMGLEFTKGKMDAQTKALAAMEAIMQDTGKAQGDFARTSDQLANSSKTLGALITDLSSDLGEIFIPIARKTVLKLSEMVLGVKGTVAALKDLSKAVEMKRLVDEIALLDTNIERLTDPKGFNKLGIELNKFLGQQENLNERLEGFQKRRNELYEQLNTLLSEQNDLTKKGNKLVNDSVPTINRIAEIKKRILDKTKNEKLETQAMIELMLDGLVPAAQKWEGFTKLTEKEFRTIPSYTRQISHDIEFAADNQRRWAEEAEATREKLFEAAGILNDIAQIAAGRKISFSGLLQLGASIAMLIPGGQGVATGLQAGAIATRGFQGGGRPPVGRPSVVGERGPEMFVPDRPGTIVPNHEVNNNQKININIYTQSVDESFVRAELIPRLQDVMRQQGSRLS